MVLGVRDLPPTGVRAVVPRLDVALLALLSTATTGCCLCVCGSDSCGHAAGIGV